MSEALLHAITLTGWALAYLYALWLLYVLIMGFYRAHLDKRLHGAVLVLASPAIVIGFAVDLLANWTLAALIFWEIPRKPLELVTDRLNRYINYPNGRRQAMAMWVCDTLLDIFDPTGKHCK